jgi:hypothetical protein
VDLGDQRAGGIDLDQPPRTGRFTQRGRDAVGAVDEDRPGRDVGHIIDEDHAAGAEVFHDVAIVHDLVIDIDRRAPQAQHLVHDLDGHVDASAEPAGIGQEDVHGMASGGGLHEAVIVGAKGDQRLTIDE